jgi:RNA polymerase sigma-70 factor (ECF subfamily)
MEATARQARDEWLAWRCKLRAPGAFEGLVREMERPLLYYVTKLLNDEHLALDVLQEVWGKAFRGMRSLEEPRALRPWLYRIAHGLAVDRVRRDTSRERAERAWAEQAPAGEEPGFEADDAAAIHRALDEIDARHREVLVLHFLEDLAVGEIASVIGCPEGTVKSRIHFAKRALKEVLGRGGYGPEEK